MLKERITVAPSIFYSPRESIISQFVEEKLYTKDLIRFRYERKHTKQPAILIEVVEMKPGRLQAACRLLVLSLINNHTSISVRLDLE